LWEDVSPLVYAEDDSPGLLLLMTAAFLHNLGEKCQGETGVGQAWGSDRTRAALVYFREL